MSCTSTATSGRGGLSGEAFDEGVGEDLPARPVIPGRDDGVGMAAQRGQAGHALLDRQVARQHAHRVRAGRSPTRRCFRSHPPALRRPPGPPRTHPPRQRRRPPGRPARQVGVVQPRVDRLDGSRCRGAGSVTTASALRSPPPRRRGPRTCGQVEPPRPGRCSRRSATEGRDPTGQADLSTTPRPTCRGMDVLGELTFHPRPLDPHRRRRLHRDHRTAEPFQDREPVGQVGLRTPRRPPHRTRPARARPARRRDRAGGGSTGSHRS